MSTKQLKDGLEKLDEEKTATRRAELRAIDWKTLWGLPAMFAAGVMLFFAVAFWDKTVVENEGVDKEPSDPEDG